MSVCHDGGGRETIRFKTTSYLIEEKSSALDKIQAVSSNEVQDVQSCHDMYNNSLVPELNVKLLKIFQKKKTAQGRVSVSSSFDL